MQRRALVNYRLPPKAVAALLPPPFRPHLVPGHGIAGICLIRRGDVRPAGLPPALGTDDASAFFRCAPLDCAATPAAGIFDGVALATQDWAIAALHLDELPSSMFDAVAVPDSALLMAGVDTTWRPQPQLLAAR